jgi:hypothetical protein
MAVDERTKRTNPERASSAAWVALVALAGCESIAGLDIDVRPAGEGGASTSVGTSTAGGEAGGGGGVTGCIPFVPPNPPSTDDATGSTSFVLALRSVNFGEDGIVDGYDLDGRCTCPSLESAPTNEYPLSCKPSPKTEATFCDQPGGVDAQSTNLFRRLGLTGFASENISDNANLGEWSWIFAISDYNGGANDTQIRVALYMGAPTTTTPRWDGTDSRPIDSASVIDGLVDQPRYVTTTAYVSEGILVASVSESAIFVRTNGGGQLEMRVDSGLLTGKLTAGAAGYTLEEGIFAAKWSLENALLGADTFRTPEGVAVCTDDFAFPSVLNAICDNLDVNAGAPNVAEYCDAMSFGIGFTAGQAVLGPVVDVPGPPTACTPETLPSNAVCEFLVP